MNKLRKRIIITIIITLLIIIYQMINTTLVSEGKEFGRLFGSSEKMEN